MRSLAKKVEDQEVELNEVKGHIRDLTHGCVLLGLAFFLALLFVLGLTLAK